MAGRLFSALQAACLNARGRTDECPEPGANQPEAADSDLSSEALARFGCGHARYSFKDTAKPAS